MKHITNYLINSYIFALHVVRVFPTVLVYNPAARGSFNNCQGEDQKKL